MLWWAPLPAGCYPLGLEIPCHPYSLGPQVFRMAGLGVPGAGAWWLSPRVHVPMLVAHLILSPATHHTVCVFMCVYTRAHTCMHVCAHMREFWSLFSVCYLHITFLYDILICLFHGPHTHLLLEAHQVNKHPFPCSQTHVLSSQEDIASFKCWA